MAYDGWLQFDGIELVNISRTAQLAEAMGIDTVWTHPDSVAWIQAERDGVEYDVVAEAPWYDPGHAPSTEFAGLVPLSFPGLDDSTTEASTTEYVTDGGRSGRTRNSTLPIVASVAIIASTERGAEFGKRWLDRTLRASRGRNACSGVDLHYYRYAGAGAPVAHRRQVRMTRGCSVTRKRVTDCSVTWLVTFTLTCDDPYEYGEPIETLDDLGGVPTGDVLVSGNLALIETACPVYDYDPIYDPLHPALIPSPTPPQFFPTGWGITEDAPYHRYWARISAPEPSALDVVPVVRLTTDADTRMVRVSIWPGDATVDSFCDPLWSAVVTYLPSTDTFYIDGEQKAAYVWDGASSFVRRTDSLVYGPEAKPIGWDSFNDPEDLLVTLDVFDSEAEGSVRAALALVPKSD